MEITKQQISEIIWEEDLKNIIVSSTQENFSFYIAETNTFYISESETDLSCLFYRSKYLKTIKFENFNFSKVKSIKQMFAYNISLEELDLSMLDTSSLEDIEGCFSFCYELKRLKLPEFKHPIKSLHSAFARCGKLEEINLSTLVLDPNWSYNIKFLFSGTYKLKVIYLNKLELNEIEWDNNLIRSFRCFFDCNPDVNIFCKKNQRKIIGKVWDKTYYEIW